MPSLVPEGSDYQFTVDIVNADNADSNNPFGHPVLYDELPYIDDHNTNGEDRNSKWSGIVNLDSIKYIGNM